MNRNKLLTVWKTMKNIVRWLNNRSIVKRMKIYSYLINGRKPWSAGYSLFKENIIKKFINDSLTIEIFKKKLAAAKAIWRIFG
jgi:hypothetical protein